MFFNVSVNSNYFYLIEDVVLHLNKDRFSSPKFVSSGSKEVKNMTSLDERRDRRKPAKIIRKNCFCV